MNRIAGLHNTSLGMPSLQKHACYIHIRLARKMSLTRANCQRRDCFRYACMRLCCLHVENVLSDTVLHLDRLGLTPIQ
jgi:hypothetical protein